MPVCYKDSQTTMTVAVYTSGCTSRALTAWSSSYAYYAWRFI